MNFITTFASDLAGFLARIELLVPTTFGEQVAIAALVAVLAQAAVEFVATSDHFRNLRRRDFSTGARVLTESTTMNSQPSSLPMIRSARPGRRVRRTRALFPRGTTAVGNPVLRQPYTIAPTVAL